MNTSAEIGFGRPGLDRCSDAYKWLRSYAPDVKYRIESKAFFAAILLLLFTLVCPLARPFGKRSQTPDWQEINADGLFCFSLPQGFIKTDMAGVEHYLSEYYKGKTRFLFISGDTASKAYEVRHQPDMEDYQETETRIGGKLANIRTYSQIRNGARIYHAELNIGNWEKGDVELYMEVESSSPDDLRIAKQIFNSIKFLTQKSAG